MAQASVLRVAHPGIAVELSDIEVRYRSAGPAVLQLERLHVEHGERVAVIGSSGSGKTTLLRLINGHVKDYSGRLRILDTEIAPRSVRGRDVRRRVGFVFQDFSLIERATVMENVLVGRLGWTRPWLSLLGRFTDEDRRLAEQAIEEVDLTQQLDQRADTLSGGEQQRVAVARVLAQQAELILADEPTSNLDPTLSEEMLELLGAVTSRHGVTLLVSLHQPMMAARFADRIIGLRAGKMVYDGPPGGLTPSVLGRIYEREEAPPGPHREERRKASR